MFFLFKVWRGETGDSVPREVHSLPITLSPPMNLTFHVSSPYLSLDERRHYEKHNDKSVSNTRNESKSTKKTLTDTVSTKYKMLTTR